MCVCEVGAEERRGERGEKGKNENCRRLFFVFRNGKRKRGKNSLKQITHQLFLHDGARRGRASLQSRREGRSAGKMRRRQRLAELERRRHHHRRRRRRRQRPPWSTTSKRRRPRHGERRRGAALPVHAVRPEVEATAKEEEEDMIVQEAGKKRKRFFALPFFFF